MDILDVADVEDVWLGSDLYEEWEQEYEEMFFKPYKEMGEANIARELPDEVLDMLERVDPEVHKKFMQFREQEEKLQELRESGGEYA